MFTALHTIPTAFHPGGLRGVADLHASVRERVAEGAREGRGRVAASGGGLREALGDVLRQVPDGQHLEVHHERRSRQAPRRRRPPARAPQAQAPEAEPELPRPSPRGACAQAPRAEADVRDLVRE